MYGYAEVLFSLSCDTYFTKYEALLRTLFIVNTVYFHAAIYIWYTVINTSLHLHLKQEYLDKPLLNSISVVLQKKNGTSTQQFFQFFGTNSGQSNG